MLDQDISTARALRELTVPDTGAGDDRAGSLALDRRRFLSLIGAGIGAGLVAGPGTTLLGALPGVSDQSAWAAGPLADGEGILVVLGMFGGNDGLNTVVRTTDGHYYDKRGPLAIAPSNTLRLDGTSGLHPELTELKRLWDAGDVAIVEGVGYPNQDLSHFNSMAWWMSGRIGGVPSSGWLGRWLDGHLAGKRDLFSAVEVGNGLPLHVRGEASQATVVPAGRPGFGASTDQDDLAIYNAVRSMHWARDDSWRHHVGQAFVDQLEVGARLGPVVPGSSKLAETRIVAQAEVMARLINANVGFRVLTAGWGDFDSHAGQPSQHTERMAEFNAALKRFFEVLHPDWRSRVTVMTFSEFGRTPYGNDGEGTDHGSAAPHFVIGPQVRGGFYGQRPALAGLGRWDRMPHHVDFRDYFGSVLDGWMGGGGSEVFGRTISDLRLFAGPPTGGGSGGGGGTSTRTPGTLVPAGPDRILDTRKGIGARAGTIGPGETLTVSVLGKGPIPQSGVRAIVANVTLIAPSEHTHLRVFAGGAKRPSASTVNAVPGFAVPNVTVVPVGSDGTIKIFNAKGNAHCIVDVSGYFVDHGGTFLTPQDPTRILDTRHGIGRPQQPLRGGQIVTVQATGVDGIPASGVSAVAVNLTTVGASERGFATAWRHGGVRPTTSNVNYVPGRAIANLSMVPVDSSGRFSLFVSSGQVEVIADVVGVFRSDGSRFVPMDGTRVLDTRNGTGATRQALGPGREIELAVAGRGGVPSNATAVMLNATAVGASGPTHLRIYPSGTSRPNASSLNLDAGKAVANGVIAKLGSGGKIKIFNATGSVQVIADVTGYFVE